MFGVAWRWLQRKGFVAFTRHFPDGKPYWLIMVGAVKFRIPA